MRALGEVMKLQRTVLIVPSDDFGWDTARTALEAIPEVHSVSIATDAPNAIELVTAAEPDFIFIAEEINGECMLPLIEEMRRRCPMSKIVLLTVTIREGLVSALNEIGITAYVAWSSLRGKYLREFLVTVIENDLLLASRDAVQPMRDALRQVSSTSDTRNNDDTSVNLTPQQRAILRLVAEGLTNREIDDRLCISENTIGAHLKEIHQRLGVHKRSAAVQRAREHGLLD